MVDATGKGELPLKVIRDVGFNLRGRHAGVEGRNGHNGQVHRGEHIYRHV